MKNFLFNSALLIKKTVRILPRKLGWYFFGILLFIALFLYILKLIEPSSPPQNILVTNLSDHQATISWTTLKATKGVIVIAEDGKFPVLPVFARKIYKDDGEKNLARERFYTTHHVTIEGLSPRKTYQYLIYQGWKRMTRGSFATGPILPSINNPNPVYGKVLSSEKSPLIGAIIYFQVQTGKDKSALLSTMTNSAGRWSLDLGNLRTKDLKRSYKIATKSAEMVMVEAANKGKGRAFTNLGKDKPWPDIIIKSL